MVVNKEVKDKVIELLSQNTNRDTIIKELNLSKATYYRILKRNKENINKDIDNDLIIEKINKKKVEKTNYDIDIKKAILEMIPKILKHIESLDNNNKILFQHIMNNNKDLSL